ncbi:MAG: PilZ domain-containing protein [Deltaproteobacteria bacterium]|nr:PilZ domain-containing protein [Deltaproteobacteria bacterium]
MKMRHDTAIDYSTGDLAYMENEINMNLEGKERRGCKRVFYSAEDQMTGLFFFPGNNQVLLEAQIINVSLSGLHFTINRNKMMPLKMGDRLILKKLFGNSPLRTDSDVEIEIKWVLDHKSMKHVGFGCEFQNLPDMIRSELSSFIESGWDSGNAPTQ